MELEKKIEIIKRNKIEDSRGWFLKVLTGNEDGLPKHTGEVYITNANRGESKGGHYHNIAKEWFTLLFGKCDLVLVDITTNERLVISLCDDEPQTIFVPSGIAHIFINTSDSEFTLLAYSDILYDPIDTIPFINF